jgi:hypothetical protein
MNVVDAGISTIDQHSGSAAAHGDLRAKVVMNSRRNNINININNGSRIQEVGHWCGRLAKQ